MKVLKMIFFYLRLTKILEKLKNSLYCLDLKVSNTLWYEFITSSIKAILKWMRFYLYLTVAADVWMEILLNSLWNVVTVDYSVLLPQGCGVHKSFQYNRSAEERSESVICLKHEVKIMIWRPAIKQN